MTLLVSVLTAILFLILVMTIVVAVIRKQNKDIIYMIEKQSREDTRLDNVSLQIDQLARDSRNLSKEISKTRLANHFVEGIIEQLKDR